MEGPLISWRGDLLTLQSVLVGPISRLLLPFTTVSAITGEPSSFESHVPFITYSTCDVRSEEIGVTEGCFLNEVF